MRALLVAAILCAAPLVRASDTDFKLPSGGVSRGVPLLELPGMAAQAARVRDAVHARFGVEISGVPIHVLRMDEVGRLMRELGGRVGSDHHLLGWELDGHVFVHRDFAGVSDEVLIHECLHARSQRFAAEAHAARLGNVVEGVTQYLTLQALAARPNTGGFKRSYKHVYVAYTRFAEVLATLVGEPTLREAYFEKGFRSLAARVDTIAHDRRRLVEAARFLDQNNEQGAIDRLTRGL